MRLAAAPSPSDSREWQRRPPRQHALPQCADTAVEEPIGAAVQERRGLMQEGDPARVRASQPSLGKTYQRSPVKLSLSKSCPAGSKMCDIYFLKMFIHLFDWAGS